MIKKERTTTLTEALREGGNIGAWCNFASFACVELMSLLDFQFLILDMQHSEINLSDVPGLFGAFAPNGPYAMVRAPQNDYHAINWLLDQGAEGVMVPMVNSVEDARKAVSAAKFPPVGRRSFGPFRAARYGTLMAPYMNTADATATLVIQVEDAKAAENIDEILNIRGIDGVFMGPNDLAYSMLKPGQVMAGDAQQWSAFARTSEVMDLCEQVMHRCQAAKVPFGITTMSMAEAKDWLERGAQFVTFGSDFVLLRAGWQKLCGPAS